MTETERAERPPGEPDDPTGWGAAAPPPVAARLPPPAPGWGLHAKLILFSVLLTVAVVGTMFSLLAMEVRSQTRGLLAGTLSRHQGRIADLQRAETRDLMRTSSLLIESPTLRAALETYQAEWDSAGRARRDLLTTIQTEVDRLATGLDKDLLLVTDIGGRSLAARVAGGSPEAWTTADLRRQPLVRRALAADADGSPAGHAVTDVGTGPYLAGCVPIVLGGDVIGALVVGERLDGAYASRARVAYDSQVVIADGGTLVATTLPPSAAAGAVQALERGSGGMTPTVLEDEEYVTAAVPLGVDAAGQPVVLYLLQSLTRALEEPERALLRSVLLYGFLAVLLAGLAASVMSQSILRPLRQFVAFLREAAVSGDHTRRFHGRETAPEMRTLAETYNSLMSSLLEHEQRLLTRAREDLERMERLKESEKLAALGRMLSGAAHEINNPLAGVIGNIELVLGDRSVPEASRRRLETVRREGQRIVGLVRNLLKTVHRDDGRRDTVDVSEVVRASADLRRHDFQTAGLRIDLDLGPRPCIVRGSELELQQVCINVINNAYDALSEARVAGGRLHVSTRTEDGAVVVVFQDNGPGMKEPERVFENFYTTKEVGKGTGLGLSITTAIVQGHGGLISAANAPGGGARFTIRLPAAVSDESPLRREPERSAGRGAGRPAASAGADARFPDLPAPEPIRATVLVVDDEPTLLDLQITILEANGAEVTAVSNGQEALHLLEERVFDVVVTDLRMPGSVSGQDLYRWAETHRPDLARRFVFVTGDTVSESALAFLETTGRRCVQKPFSVEAYLDALRGTLEPRRAAA